jgi:hypothetical protein
LPQPSDAQGDGGGETVGGDAGAVYRILLDVRLPNGYETHARAVVTFAGQGRGPPIRTLDWLTALPAPAAP